MVRKIEVGDRYVHRNDTHGKRPYEVLSIYDGIAQISYKYNGIRTIKDYDVPKFTYWVKENIFLLLNPQKQEQKMEQVKKKLPNMDKEKLRDALFSIYLFAKKDVNFSMGKILDEYDLPDYTSDMLKQLKMIQHNGKSGSASRWNWIYEAAPDDKMLKEILEAGDIYLKMVEEKKQRKSQPTDYQNIGANSIYVKEKLDIFDDKLNQIIEQNEQVLERLTTLFNAWDIKTNIKNEEQNEGK